jgi:hypothetical protein
MWVDDVPKSAGADAFGLLHPDDNGHAMMSTNLYRRWPRRTT